MKILSQSTPINYKASSKDLKILENLRDRNVSGFEILQRQKVETLLKFREVKKMIESYDAALNEYSVSSVSDTIIARAKSDLADLKNFKDVLWNKLREINLSLLAEEEKNY